MRLTLHGRRLENDNLILLGEVMGMNVTKKLLIIGLAAALTACATKNELGQDASGVLNDANGLNGGIIAPAGSIAEFKQVVGDSILFDTNQTSVNEAGKLVLQKQYAWLRQYNVTSIKVEGHADERGTRQYNIALGAKRAASVKNYFITLGYSANAITTLSFGKERPISLCDNISCWSQNRRSVTSVVGK